MEERIERPEWAGPPETVLPGVVPVELIIGSCDVAAVTLTGIRAFPSRVAMSLGVRTRRRAGLQDIHEEIFDRPYRHEGDEVWQQGRLEWGFEFADRDYWLWP